MIKCTIEEPMFVKDEVKKRISHILKTQGTVTGTSGGFPLSPLAYHWEGSEVGANELQALGARVYKY